MTYNTITYSEARQNFSSLLDKVAADTVPTVVVRQAKKGKKVKPVLLISLEEYESLMETLYLKSSPNNHQKMMEAINSPMENSLIFKNVEELRAYFENPAK